MKKETIHIACNIDDAYLKYCIVMLTSLFENNRDESFRIHIIAASLTYESRKKLRLWVEGRYKQELCIYEAGEKMLKRC